MILENVQGVIWRKIHLRTTNHTKQTHTRLHKTYIHLCLQLPFTKIYPGKKEALFKILK